MGLPPDLDAVVVKCLAKDPRDRYQTVAELAFALEPWAAIEGSAKRILHVMQMVQKTDVPTMMNVDAAASNDGAPKTMDAWDSGERTRRNGSGLPRGAWAALGVAGFLGLVGVAAIVSLRVHKPTHPIAAGSAAASAIVVDPTQPPPAPTPVPVPVPENTPAGTATAPAATGVAVEPAPVATTEPPPSNVGAGPAPDPAPPITSTLTTTTAAARPPTVKPPTVKPPTARPTTTTNHPLPSAKPKSTDPGNHM